MYKIILSIFLFISLYATDVDSDLDGVIDSQDKCPNTPFLEIVNKYGCSKSQLKSNFKINMYIGYETDKIENTDYYTILSNISATYKLFSLSYTYSSLSMNKNKNFYTNDSIIAIKYKHKFSNSYLKFTLSTYLTTYYNKNIDYAVKIAYTYAFQNLNLTISQKHKIYTDNNTNPKDTTTIEIGKSINRFYISPYFYIENSQYDDNQWSSYAGIFTQYSFNNKTYTSIDISKNINNQSILSIVGILGYNF